MADEHLPADLNAGDFSLKQVCWGYRDLFARSIEGLYYDGWIGKNRPEATGAFFDLLSAADQSCYDHVLKEFVCALNPRTRWMIDLPGVFTDVIDMGRRFAEIKLYYGIGYFRALGEGGFGDTPAQARFLMSLLARLLEVDPDLAFALLKSYRPLTARLRPREIELFLDEAVRIHQRNPAAGVGFVECSLKSAENVILSLTKECRLQDVQPALETLLRALVGDEVEVGSLAELDSDHLIERGASVVCLYRWLYLPGRLRFFGDAGRNRSWYKLMAVVAAGMLAERSFPSIHGHAAYRTVEDLAGPEVLPRNVLQIIELVRVLGRIRDRWPGAVSLLDFGWEQEWTHRPATTGAERLLQDALHPEKQSKLLQRIREEAAASVNVLDTAERLGPWIKTLRSAYRGIDRHPLRAFSFLPDWDYPGGVSVAPPDRLILDLRQEMERNRRDRVGEQDASQAQAAVRDAADADGTADENKAEEEGSVRTAYVYDEWSQIENDYHRDHCFVREEQPDAIGGYAPPELGADAQRIRQVFERLKPDLVRKEKYLPEGDIINPDLLLEWRVRKTREPSPPVRFYEKPLINRRDLAVLVLLDVSGSTGETAGQEKVIEIEKRAALLLGQGLDALGDRFAVCGFSTNGREQCSFLVYKDFTDDWRGPAMSRLLAARPANATRIGAALRHAGYRLERIEARQRLILLITDGKPMDAGYDPHSRYAQHDVRMACEENERLGIHTLGISTEENSVADMEIMFPGRRFVILPDMRHLPRVLPRLYVKLTA